MRTATRFLAISLLALVGAAAAASPAQALGPGWQISSEALPTHIPPGGKGIILVHPADVGGGVTDGSQVTVTDTLPEGLVAIRSGELDDDMGHISDTRWLCSGTTVVSCHNDPTGMPVIGPESNGYVELPSVPHLIEELPDAAPEILIEVEAEPGAAEGPAVNTAEISGGGAPAALSRQPLAIGSAPVQFGIASFEVSAYAEDGSADAQAGSHPDGLSANIAFDTAPDAEGNLRSPAYARDIEVEAPGGLVGDPQAVPRCTRAVFDGRSDEYPECPSDTQVGEVTVEIGDSVTAGTRLPTLILTLPLFNLVPPPGVAAQFGFMAQSIFGTLDAGLRSDGDYGITESVHAVQRSIVATEVRLWGVPASPAHDARRVCTATETLGCPSEAAPEPFLSLPTSCGQELPWTARIDSWLNPTDVVEAKTTTVGGDSEPFALSGCNRLAFDPTITSRPTTDVADSASGLEFDLHVPQTYTEPEGTATANLKSATVTLPEGVTVDPSSANGLGACGEEQVGYQGVKEGRQSFSKEPASCPDAAKLGTVSIDTPLLEEELPGSVYLARPFDNPFGTLLALYLVVEEPERGITVKLPGKVVPDERTGQLTATFPEDPQLPFGDFHLDFFGGAAGPLRTPATCGDYTTTTDLVPWSAPEGADAHPTDAFTVSQGAGGGSCPTSPSQEPNSPAFAAGTTSPAAGSYSPFVLRLAREDGSQEISSIDTTLPEGLTGKLAGVAECTEAQIAQARSREHPGGGAEEQASPSCPASSQVGTVTVGAGAGPAPYYVTGHAYLAGPYQGAPLSLVIVTPAVAGPLDLGAVVVRAALRVDPETTRITAVSGPIPRILDGIPLDVRSISLQISRNQFTLNPTSCQKTAVTGTETSVLGSTAPLSDPFQVGGCSALKFKPKLRLSLKGSTKHAGHPALKAVLTYPQGGAYANIARAQVNLPHSLFLDQGNIADACTRPVLLEGHCPASSVYGEAEAWTPLLEAPLEGPVYLVGGYGYELPALVAELDGQIRVLLVGKVDSGPNHGLRDTFEAVPDAPVSKFVLEMKGGPRYSLLENSEDLCSRPQKAIARFTAQSGRVLTMHPTIATGCGGKKGKGTKRRHGGKGR